MAKNYYQRKHDAQNGKLQLGNYVSQPYFGQVWG
jgi:hypothetical protein